MIEAGLDPDAEPNAERDLDSEGVTPFGATEERDLVIPPVQRVSPTIPSPTAPRPSGQEPIRQVTAPPVVRQQSPLTPTKPTEGEGDQTSTGPGTGEEAKF
jgi:hypothetical protein